MTEAEAEIEASGLYLTNAVKHFKWKPRGKRRLHDTPRAGEVSACRPWLEAETPLAPLASVTGHPSAILRSRDAAEREEGLSALVEDLCAFAASVREG